MEVDEAGGDDHPRGVDGHGPVGRVNLRGQSLHDALCQQQVGGAVDPLAWVDDAPAFYE